MVSSAPDSERRLLWAVLPVRSPFCGLVSFYPSGWLERRLGSLPPVFSPFLFLGFFVTLRSMDGVLEWAFPIGLRQVLEAVLAEGALESPSILVLAFHSSLSFVEGLSDGLAASVRALLDGCASLTPFVLSAVAFARTHSSSLLFLLLWA